MPADFAVLLLAGGLAHYAQCCPQVHVDLKSGALQSVLPAWSFEPLPVTMLTVSRRLMPAKTRVFIDHLFETVQPWAPA